MCKSERRSEKSKGKAVAQSVGYVLKSGPGSGPDGHVPFAVSTYNKHQRSLRSTSKIILIYMEERVIQFTHRVNKVVGKQ